MLYKKKLILSYVIMALVTIGVATVLVGWFTITRSEAAIREIKKNSLTAIRESKKQQIEQYFQDIRDQITTYASSLMLVDIAGEFVDAFEKSTNELSDADKVTEMKQKIYQYYQDEFLQQYKQRNNGKSYDIDNLFNNLDQQSVKLQYDYIANNQHPLGEKDKMDKASSNSYYDVLHQQFHPVIRNFLKKFEYYDIFIVNPKTGDIVYSVFKELDYSTSLFDGPYADSKIGEAFQQANELTKGQAYLTDFAPYSPSYEDQAFFIATPIYKGTEKIAVLIFQMPIDRINNIMTYRGNWIESGLGLSGETYLLGEDFKLRSQSRFIIQDSFEFLGMLRELKINENTINQIADKDSTIGLLEVRTPGAFSVMKGQEGFGSFWDYRQIKVLSSFSPLNIQNLKWGILSEIDEAEALELSKELRDNIIRTSIMIFAILSISAFIIGYVMSYRLSKSIGNAVAFANNISKGKLDNEIKVTEKDEIGDLLVALNTMQNEIDSRIQIEKMKTKELNKMNTELEQKTEVAEQSVRSKNTFLANVSHELRTPLNAILGMLEVVLENGLSGEDKKNLEIAKKSGESLLNLINDLLDYSKLESNQFKLHLEYSNLESLLQEVVDTFKINAEEKNLDLEYSISNLVNMGLVFKCDVQRIRQVLSNLVGNAIKFTEKGRVDILMKIKPYDEYKYKILFEVKDTGIGIDSKEKESLFQPFVQEDSSSTRQFGGTGLGLSISSSLVELMQGTIGCESLRGQGSSFWFELSLKPAKKSKLKKLSQVVETGSHVDASGLRGKKILVVDDTEININIVSLMLSKYHCELDTAKHGGEAVEASRETHYDIILMDCLMPVMDGYTATKTIRQEESNPNKNTPILAISATTNEQALEKCQRAGMESFLLKPFKKKQLIEEILKLIK